MIIHTCSEGITAAKKLENDSAALYESMAKQFSGEAETFLGYAKENKKNIVQVERAYFGVITDAIEGCFAFNLDTDKYVVDTGLPQGADRAGALKKAIQTEETMINFYTEAAEQSHGLMADVPRAFSLIAKKRENRLAKLKSL